MICIAITPNINDGMVAIRDTYLDSVYKAGAMPILLQPRADKEFIKSICACADGFIFSGGEDIDPAYYGEENTASKNICSIRDEFEKMLFDAAIKTGKPILGICRGMQAINVFLGGSLHQHIDGHVQEEHRSVRTHEVSLTEDSMLAKILDTEVIDVNSFHHQAVKVLADGLAIDAVSRDGYIEACHATEHPFLLCVQWHPESYYNESDTSRKIFKKFIEACKN